MPYELRTLGFGPFFDEQWSRIAEAHLVPARIASEHRGAYEVFGEAGAGAARLAGRLRHELGDDAQPGVGDWVALDGPPRADRTAAVQRLLRRRTVFTRASPGRRAQVQVIAANVDLVLVVCGLDEDFSVRRIERYVARIRASGAEPAVVLSKADLVDDPGPRVAEVRGRAPGVSVEAISAVRGEGVAGIRARLSPGITAALVGSSGAGKSTLANALLGEERLATGAVSARDGRGSHVTTRRQLALVPGGGILLDTPGLRELQLSSEEGLAEAFDDVARLAEGCRFADCSHETEPGCAVRAAAAAGDLEPERLDHFLELRREARAWERRHDERLRRADERAWGRLIHEAHRQIRRKRGE